MKDKKEEREEEVEVKRKWGKKEEAVVAKSLLWGKHL